MVYIVKSGEFEERRVKQHVKIINKQNDEAHSRSFLGPRESCKHNRVKMREGGYKLKGSKIEN